MCVCVCVLMAVFRTNRMAGRLSPKTGMFYPRMQSRGMTFSALTCLSFK